VTTYMSPQSLKHWHPTPFTTLEIRHCELIAGIIMAYREKHNFLVAPCWMDEWALGYICANRDQGIINNAQAHLLFSAFQPEE
jgi:hypothetical protein